MKMRFKAAVGSLLVGGALAGAAVMPAAGQAAAVGDVCYLHSWAAPAPVLAQNGQSVLYWLAAGSGFRITGFYVDFYTGHGNGLADGFLHRTYINQATCS